jgi:hypothetical protein
MAVTGARSSLGAVSTTATLSTVPRRQKDPSCPLPARNVASGPLSVAPARLLKPRLKAVGTDDALSGTRSSFWLATD